MPDIFANLPCKDSDVAEVAIGDYPTLVAKCERVAFGEDGVIAPFSFVLSSAGFPFEQQGIQVGHVMILKDRQDVNLQGHAVTKAMNDQMPVVSVSGSTVTLGRFGYPAGQGAFPGPPAGSTGVEFFAPTLVAQIITATDEVKRQLAITIDTTLVNTRDLRYITILMVLRGLYFAQYRQSTDDTYKSKMKDLDVQMKSEFMSLVQTYGQRTSTGRKALIAPMTDDPCWRIPYTY